MMINENVTMQSLSFGNEKNKVIYCNDFLVNPLGLVDFASGAVFSHYAAASQRKGYPGVRTPMPADVADEFKQTISDIIKAEFNIPAEAKVTALQNAMCLMTVPEQELGPLQRIPHFDASNPRFFATLLYFCGEEHGGTGFYRHNSTGYESITPERCDPYLDVSYEELNRKNPERRYFSESDDFFTKIGFVPAQFNRLVIYPGCLLHSANILSEISLSADPKTGRLTANNFFIFE